MRGVAGSLVSPVLVGREAELRWCWLAALISPRLRAPRFA
jgi:hypothetical protein